MKVLLHIILFLPLAGFVFSLVIPAKREGLISWVSYFTIGVQILVFIALMMVWFNSGFPYIALKDLVLYKIDDYEFFIDISFDKFSATYMFVGSTLAFLVTVYSRTYLHREMGYKRFFNTILFFYFGFNLVVLAGNFETLFIGWEILGISSFLLIAFYRDRYLPVKNAVKVFSIYRIGDVGLVLAMWMSHHLWHENITFEELMNYNLVHTKLQSHTLIGVFVSLTIVIAAAAKSAQLPFSSWLPRAMEGPTPSTAIFYGSLSVHVGVFLLLRTFHFWEHQLSVRILIGVLGFTTSIVATFIARVQSSVKSQIAYASIAQIGLIFIEVSLGWLNLALIHFAGNAFLRTYQLLVSPSVVTYLIREQFYNYKPRQHSVEDSFPKKLEYSLYILSLKEWNLDSFMYRYYWNPMKWTGKKLSFITLRSALTGGVILFFAGVIMKLNQASIPIDIFRKFPIFFAILGLMCALKAFTERKDVYLSWILVTANHFWVALAIAFNADFLFEETVLYLSGVIISGIVGLVCLRMLTSLEKNINLDRFHGHIYMYPGLGLAFLLACLCVTGFPITPTFIGEDVVFARIREDQVWLATFVALCFVIDGLAVIRLYARVFLGPHVNSVYEMGYRSS